MKEEKGAPLNLVKSTNLRMQLYLMVGTQLLLLGWFYRHRLAAILLPVRYIELLACSPACVADALPGMAITM
jgi:hypothetical protein